MLRCLLLLAAFCALPLVATAGAEGWAGLEVGMTPQKAAELLGRPLMRTANRGYELWIYDSQAEVVFFGGPVIAWSPPVPNPLSESRPAGTEMSVPYDFLPLWRSDLKPAARAPATGGAYLVPEFRFRYRQRYQ